MVVDIMLKNIFNKKNSDEINMLSPISLDLKSRGEDGRWEYLDRLNKAIYSEDGYNIAISGSYGTGKSSIVKTYIKRLKKESKSLTINIGSFLKTSSLNNIKNDEEANKSEIDNTSNVQSSENNDIDNNADDEVLSYEEELLMEKIEKTIVKQLIYKVKFSKSRLSSIPRVQRNWNFKYFVYSLFITYIFACLYYFLIDKELIIKFTSFIPFYSKIPSEYLLPILKFVFIISLVVFIINNFRYLFTLINKAKSKIKLKDYELEIDSSSNSKFSFMDNLYEILYSFINSSIEIVFFEDIDRYQKDVCIKVIEDLKELNSIINGCYGMNSKYNPLVRKKIVFVYSFKDSIFYNYTEKNKFYDYIISVMPVSTRSNSPMIFINELDNANFNFNDIGSDLLNIVSLYINDMRTIKNIVNDFSLFLKILNPNLDKIDKMQVFALCVYKNYDIVGYDKLLDFDNYIDGLIKQFGDVIDEEVKNDIDELNDEINNELEIIWKRKEDFFANNSLNGENPKIIVVDDKDVTYDDFLSNKFDVSKMKGASISFKYNDNIEYPYDGEISKLINFIVSHDKKINDYNKKIEYLNHVFDNDDKIYEYSRRYLDDLFFGRKKLNSKIDKKIYQKLEFKLVYGGYIRPNYLDYISSPVDGEYFTIHDSRFIFSYNHNILNYDGKISNPDKVCEFLGVNSYREQCFLNNTLLKYFYEKNNKLGKQSLINQFCDITNERLDFLKQLNKKDNSLYKTFVSDLSSIFDRLWVSFNDKLDANKINDNEHFYEIIIDIALINKLDLDSINNIDRLREIISEFSNTNNIYFLKENSVQFQNIKDLNIHFNDVLNILSDNYDDEKRVIVTNDLFQLNKENLLTILYGNNHYIEDYRLNIDILKSSEYFEHFRNSIINNLDLFANNIYLGDNNKEFIINDQDLIKDILMKTQDDLLIKEIIHRENFKVDYKISSIYFKELFDYGHISLNWDIVNQYYVGSFPADNDLFNIVVENIDLFYKKDIKEINYIGKKFMQMLVDYLYKYKKYTILNVIFGQYDLEKLDKYYAYVDLKLDELEHKIDYNLIQFNKQSCKQILKRCKKEKINTYIKNALSENRFDLISDLIDSETLVDSKKYFSDNQKIIILNNICERKGINIEELQKVFKKIFSSNVEYKVSYKKIYENNIFENVKELLSVCDHEPYIIRFKLK